MFRVFIAAVFVCLAAAIGVAPAATATPPDKCSQTTRCDIPQGDPDYGPWLDRDHDGLACEC